MFLIEKKREGIAATRRAEKSEKGVDLQSLMLQHFAARGRSSGGPVMALAAGAVPWFHDGLAALNIIVRRQLPLHICASRILS